MTPFFFSPINTHFLTGLWGPQVPCRFRTYVCFQTWLYLLHVFGLAPTEGRSPSLCKQLSFNTKRFLIRGFFFPSLSFCTLTLNIIPHSPDEIQPLKWLSFNGQTGASLLLINNTTSFLFRMVFQDIFSSLVYLVTVHSLNTSDLTTFGIYRNNRPALTVCSRVLSKMFTLLWCVLLSSKALVDSLTAVVGLMPAEAEQ